MRKSTLLAILLFVHAFLFAQCLTAPALPACTGTETLLSAGENVVNSNTRYHYGLAGTLSNVKLSGGTLVVCNDLTLNDLVFDSGTVYIRPGATLVINNPAGLIVRGHTRIYNAGTFQCLGNFVMEGTWATAAKPNVFINMNAAAYFKMPNQYFVINNPHSKLVNNGTADFHGVITDPLSAGGSVCLGFNSQTRMRVLYNKAKNTYIAPDGAACVLVEQFSQFYDTLTNYPTVNACLGATHSSDASCLPWGCKPNAWGSAQVTNGCSSCASVLTFLSAPFTNFTAMATGFQNALRWQSGLSKGIFYIQRSGDGRRFITLDSMESNQLQDYRYTDQYPGQHEYYRITWKRELQEHVTEVLQVKRNDPASLYPNPFQDEIHLPVPVRAELVNIIVTDASGRNVPVKVQRKYTGQLTLDTKQFLSGTYFIRVNTGARQYVYKASKL